MLDVRFSDAAEIELDEAIDFYNGQSQGLGLEFLAEMLGSIERIRQFPNAWHPLDYGLRRCHINRFPYGVVYAVEDNVIIVAAIAHWRQKPKDWKSRLAKQ